jgi:hypothetical protein
VNADRNDPQLTYHTFSLDQYEGGETHRWQVNEFLWISTVIGAQGQICVNLRPSAVECFRGFFAFFAIFRGYFGLFRLLFAPLREIFQVLFSVPSTL